MNAVLMNKDALDKNTWMCWVKLYNKGLEFLSISFFKRVTNFRFSS